LNEGGSAVIRDGEHIANGVQASETHEGQCDLPPCRRSGSHPRL
jgi:hypothetical protein